MTYQDSKTDRHSLCIELLCLPRVDVCKAVVVSLLQAEVQCKAVVLIIRLWVKTCNRYKV